MAQEEELDISAFLNSLSKFEKLESEDCIFCGRHVAYLKKMGRCVYAYPCACRLWQGQLPDTWISSGRTR